VRNVGICPDDLFAIAESSPARAAYPARSRISLREAILWYARDRRTSRSGRSSCPLDDLYESDPASHQLVKGRSSFWSATVLRRAGRWLNSITASRIATRKELRPSPGRSEIRILLVPGPRRAAIRGRLRDRRDGYWHGQAEERC
jgi:hypothetical protein